MRTGAKIFISYSHRDEDLKNRLVEHLSGLQRQGLVDVWHDRRISPGDHRESSISQQLAHADIILLLISASFIASDYCYGLELKTSLERHRSGLARVIPVILRPVDWSMTPFRALQALPADGRPVTAWKDVDEAYLDIAKGISSVVRDFLAGTDVDHHELTPASGSSSIIVPSSLVESDSSRHVSDPLELTLAMRETDYRVGIRTPRNVEIGRLARYVAASLFPHLLHRGYEWTIEPELCTAGCT